jgi:hypothetical protein
VRRFARNGALLLPLVGVDSGDGEGEDEGGGDGEASPQSTHAATCETAAPTVRRTRRRIRDGVAMVVELCNEYCGRVLLYLSVLGEITREKKSCSASVDSVSYIHILSL